MIKINKGSSPSELDQYKRECSESISRGTTKLLDDFSRKDDLRISLAEEQGYLCAYCMQRINPENGDTKIEHFHPQTEYPTEQLDYSNLLLCCNGNQGDRPANQHCDTKKKNAEIKYNPALSPSIEQTIRYERDGKIVSDDEDWNNHIDNVLNLNYSRLRENRESVLRAVDQALAKNSGMRSKSQIDTIIQNWKAKNSSGELKEYCGAAIYRLQKHPAYKRG
ncbi:retron system putative HNH endonuclease [Sediminispirochaeta bajacaliforniensis]|uniref:retron system putative HNH endonuclease n=1 Tax=Sediminispirochaeta bajacaliforniensis TaxID=148 RepID=UPI000378F1BD|nr:retron system putative HNH endonuclease [Sediminispirochaeta bajacaliforniensis]